MAANVPDSPISSPAAWFGAEQARRTDCIYETFRCGEGETGLIDSSASARRESSFAEVPRLTSAQIELLELIDSIANDSAFYLDMNFEPGDMQFLKNAVILHARTE